MKLNFDDLIEKGLVKEKRYDNGLRVLKYARKVFYDNLWHLDTRLLEARGIVLDSEDNIVSWPFTKVFNHNENGTVCSGDRLVDVVRKVNGFMGTVSFYKDELLASTTGSLDSDFVGLVHKHVDCLNWAVLRESAWARNLTYIFEICDESDPHIVAEQTGAYLIGARRLSDGMMADEHQLNDIAKTLGCLRPEVGQVLFRHAMEVVKKVKHEGFMIRDAFTGATIMKVKSPHYLVKKFLMRMSQKKVDFMFAEPDKFREWIDEEYYGLHTWIVGNFSSNTWVAMDDQNRREVIERYFEEE